MTEMELIKERLDRLETKLLTGLDEPPYASPAATTIEVAENEVNRIRRNVGFVLTELQALEHKYDFVSVTRASLCAFIVHVEEKTYHVRYFPRRHYEVSAEGWQETFMNWKNLMQGLGALIAQVAVEKWYEKEMERESGEIENSEGGEGDGK